MIPKFKKKKNPTIIKSAVFVLVILLVGLSLKIFTQNKNVPHKNQIDLQISLNSKRPFNQNAILTDLKFKHLSFAEETQDSSLFPFAKQFASVIRAVKSLSKETAEKEYGTWIWTPILQMTPEYMQEIISGAKSNGINAIYLSIDSYLDIFTMQKGEERNIKREEFVKKLKQFIGFANKSGIAVDAEAGWQNWAEENNEYKAFAVVNFVKSFNEQNNLKFRGFQYDVEPYLLSRYQKEPESVLKNFVKLVDDTEKYLSDSGLDFTVVIPDFFDGGDKMTPKFSYKKRNAFVFDHLLNILDRGANNSLIIMSYRNFAEGLDGAIEVSANEMRTAKTGIHNTRVIIAQETGEVLPPYITFHNTSRRYFSEQISKINKAFQDNENFGGIAIHYVNAFLSMR